MNCIHVHVCISQLAKNYVRCRNVGLFIACMSSKVLVRPQAGREIILHVFPTLYILYVVYYKFILTGFTDY